MLLLHQSALITKKICIAQYETCTHIFRLQNGCITIMQTRLNKVFLISMLFSWEHCSTVVTPRFIYLDYLLVCLISTLYLRTSKPLQPKPMVLTKASNLRFHIRTSYILALIHVRFVILYYVFKSILR
jgi:hypothetical protein